MGKPPILICISCGKLAECRPYGPNGEDICFDCGMKDERESTIQMFMKRFGQTREKAEQLTDRPHRPTMGEVDASFRRSESRN